MNSNKIVFTERDKGFGQVGGSVRMDDPTLWPLAPDTQEPMTPLCTITENFLPAPVFPAGMAATVFITARKRDGYFNQSVIRRYTVHDEAELPNTHNGFARVLLHRLTDRELPAPTGTFLLERRYIDFEPMTDEEFEEEHADEYAGLGISKQLGRASWMQDPIYLSSRYVLLLQLTDYDISRWAPTQEGIFLDGVGFVYLDKQARRKKQGDEAGLFFVQYA
ncbi:MULTISPECIES: hypothetical protein [Pseudomonas]|uniref:hypothetical protein n=2 Tax=Pseudomonas TaxID=286 RepID=UPI0021BB0D91|nr:MULTISPECIES: hypothetical protein [unclassified Pseudomonas]MCT8165081.1 hypothetical protein [Pseudomonas sp. HD6422]MCT8184040.1 hypothetical protein [Pseudomonas sp. HD6421]